MTTLSLNRNEWDLNSMGIKGAKFWNVQTWWRCATHPRSYFSSTRTEQNRTHMEDPGQFVHCIHVSVLICNTDMNISSSLCMHSLCSDCTSKEAAHYLFNKLFHFSLHFHKMKFNVTNYLSEHLSWCTAVILPQTSFFINSSNRFKCNGEKLMEG